MLNNIVEELADLLREEGGGQQDELVEIMRGGFAKNEPISCLHHCLSVALISARIAEHMGYNEDDVALAYAAGLVHDYEKLGPAMASTSDERKIEIISRHLDHIGAGDEGVAKRALRIARGLEEGFTPLPDRRIARIVKLADYTMGLRYESSDPVSVTSYIASMSQELLGRRLEAYPILLGSQRPITLNVAEKITNIVEECGGAPLVATPMGFIYLSSQQCASLSNALGEIAENIVAEFSEKAASTRGKTSGQRPVEDAEMRGIRLCEAVRANKNPGSAVSMKRPPSLRDAEEIINALLSGGIPEGRRPYVLAGLLIYAAKVLNPENPKKAIPLLAALFGAIAKSWKELPKVLGICEGRMPSNLEEGLKKLAEELRRSAERLGGGEVISYLAKRLNEVVHVPTLEVEAEHVVDAGSVRCSLCRAPVPEKLAQQFTLKKYRDVLSSAGIRLAQEVFHPDVQGAPADTRIAEEVRKLPVCPLCFYEAKYMARSGIVPGNWSTVIYYGPSVAYDLLQIAKKVVTQRGEVRVFADPLSARLVAPHNTPYLTKTILRWAFRSWYLVGGSLAITRNPFTLPTPVSRIIYLDKADAVIEAMDALMITILRRAARTRNYWKEGTHGIRRAVYQQLLLYVDSLEEAKAQGRVRLRPSLRIPTTSPSLTVLALYTASRLK